MKNLKSFFNMLLSDSNKVSMKRFIGLLCLVMFIAYGVAGICVPFNQSFWIFYVSLCVVTVWIAFRFMTSEKILKYGLIQQLAAFNKIEKVADAAIGAEDALEGQIQPSVNLPSSGTTGTTSTTKVDKKDEELPME